MQNMRRARWKSASPPWVRSSSKVIEPGTSGLSPSTPPSARWLVRRTPALTGAEQSEGRPRPQGEARPVERVVGQHGSNSHTRLERGKKRWFCPALRIPFRQTSNFPLLRRSAISRGQDRRRRLASAIAISPRNCKRLHQSFSHGQASGCHARDSLRQKAAAR